MIHSIAHYFKHFDIQEGTVGLEYTFLTHAMLHMLTHPHGKPETEGGRFYIPFIIDIKDHLFYNSPHVKISTGESVPEK